MSSLTHLVYITLCFVIACVTSEPPASSTIGNFGGYVSSTSGFKDGFNNQRPSTGYSVPHSFPPHTSQSYGQPSSTTTNNPSLNYGIPTSNYGQASKFNGLLPCSSYAFPPYSNYGNPSQSYGSPSQSYSSPSQTYSSQSQSYGSQSQSYDSPLQNDVSPSLSHGSPSQNYDSPSQSYGYPSQSYGSPYKNNVGNGVYNTNGNNLNGILSDGKYNNYANTGGYKF